MELATIFLSFGVIMYFFYKLLQEKRLDDTIKTCAGNLEISSKLIAEIKKREIIIKRVEDFVRGSDLIEKIGTYDGFPVFKYVTNNGIVYQFDEFLTDKTDKIGIDEMELCFNKKRYVRLKD